MSKLKKTLLGFVGERLLDQASVSSVKAVSEHFRLITLHSPALAQATWNPGEKIQLNVGDWNIRTYTPLAIDPAKAEIEILAFIHGQGPGSRWASSLQVGDSCQFLGPRSSLSLPVESQSIKLFGDETSFAVAASFVRYFKDWATFDFIFEVANPQEAVKVCAELRITQHSTLIEKRPDGSHLVDIAKLLQNGRGGKGDLEQVLLTGNEASLRRLRKLQRSSGVSSLRMKTKVYWSAGRVGID